MMRGQAWDLHMTDHRTHTNDANQFEWQQFVLQNISIALPVYAPSYSIVVLDRCRHYIRSSASDELRVS